MNKLIYCTTKIGMGFLALSSNDNSFSIVLRCGDVRAVPEDVLFMSRSFVDALASGYIATEIPQELLYGTGIAFSGLSDAPSSYVGATSGRHVVVAKSDGTGVMFKKLKPNLFEEFSASFSVTIRGGPYNGTKTAEKGYGADAANVTWGSDDAVEHPISDIDGPTMNGNPLALDVGWTIPVGGTYTPGSPITEAAEGTGFRVTLKSNSDSLTFTDGLNWVYRVWFGNSDAETLNEAGIKGLENNRLQASKIATYSIGAASGNYKYIAWPVSYGQASRFFDPNTNFDVPMESPFAVSITNAHSLTEDYWVYRSTNKLGGAMPIRAS